MAITTLKKISYVYFMACLCATIGLIIYSINRYLRNEDTTLVRIIKFLSTGDAVYPSMSFCIRPPFFDEAFEVYTDDKINMTSYMKFLNGELWNDRMLGMEYDDVTMSLTNNILEAHYHTHQGKKYTWNPDHYISFRSAERKCFSINPPLSNMSLLWYFTIRINNAIFPGGERPTGEQFLTYFHYDDFILH